ncbi:uncharacterized protein PFLUO_LOCUS890 [Penicillium psychrofluorescens]|uniref:uncharacterized protein n=1 Tax=Penicillium psychrofluorescens TaxID=3158075 RepID=UPI003CCDE06A
MCLEAYIVHVVYFRKQVLRLIRRSDPGVLSDFAQLIAQLEKCGESFPRHLHLNEINAYVNEENNQLSSFYSLHLLYNQCFCDLYRVTLPGYRFPLSAILTEQRPDSVRALQSQCAYYAQRITAILQNALSRGTKGFGDPICAICAYESSKIQIVYARTCAKEDKTAVTQNLGINLTALEIITGWDKKRVVLVSSLAKLLQDFGFSDLANEWVTRNRMRPQSSDDAPPETHHLHPLALYRMTWKEISWPQRTDTSIASTLSRPSYWPDADNGGNRAQQNDPHTSAPMEEIPFDLEGMPSVDDQLLPDVDSYLQMADDFSNYLTWDPWNFGYSLDRI